MKSELTKPVLTRDQALTALREIIRAKGPGYIYHREPGHQCMYKWRNKPSCIIGHLVHREFPEVFKTIGEPGWQNPSNTGTVYTLFESDQLPPEGAAIVADTGLILNLRTLQVKQDRGLSWDHAFFDVFGERVFE